MMINRTAMSGMGWSWLGIDIYDVSLQHGSTGVKDVLDDDDPNFKFDATSGKVIVLTPEMQNEGQPQQQAGYCAC